MLEVQLRSIQDKLRVFVSSRLLECKAERIAATDAINSINHQPVLFEHLGARPYPARALYLSRLQSAHFMIAIYREGYGYIDEANNMIISGLEDEYRFARDNQIETLFYVHADDSARQPRLAVLVNQVLQHSVPFYYRQPEDLRLQIRDDLTAAITDRVVKNDNQSGVLEDTPQKLLARTAKWSGGIIPRSPLLIRLSELLSGGGAVCLFGAAGAGKTTVAAQFAEAERATFVRVTGLSPKDIYRVCATALTGGQEATLTADNIRLAFEALGAAWRKQTSVTLVVDECDFLAELLLAIEKNGGTSPRKRLVVTSRDEVLGLSGLKIDPLTQGEVDRFVASHPDADVEAREVVVSRSIVQNEAGELDQLLSSFASGTRELVTYLAFAPAPLSAQTLIELRGQDNYGIEDLELDISDARKLIDDSPRGYRLVHDEIAHHIAQQTRLSPQRLKFYVTRLSRSLAKAGRYNYAYQVARAAADGSERVFALRALRQSTMDGDWKVAIAIATTLLSHAATPELRDEAFRLSIQLSYGLELTGNVKRADELLESAKSLSNSLDQNARDFMSEVEVATRARRTLNTGSVAALREIYDRYGANSRLWDQARVGLELAAIYMAAKEFLRSIEVLRPTLATFVEAGDEYGVDITQRNLASSLIAQDSDSLEGAALLQEIMRRNSTAEEPRRERAWLCNILARQHRKQKRLDEAHVAASEAIEIGESLGDEYLKAINLTNLGNVLSDKGDLARAVEAYHQSGAAAQRCGRRDIEANSSRLAADKLNDMADLGGSGMLEKAARARHHAEHSLGLLKDSLDHYDRAYSYVELGRALSHLGDNPGAAMAFFDAAREAILYHDDDLTESSLIHASALSLSDYPDLYTTGLAKALNAELGAPTDQIGERFFALNDVIINSTPRGALVRLLSTHLYELRAHLRPRMYDMLALKVIEVLEARAKNAKSAGAAWRVLYSSIVVAALLKDSAHRYLFFRLSQAINALDLDISARQESDNTQLWTIRLELGRPVVISICGLDSSTSSQLACLALATFIKAFQQELRDEFGIEDPMIEELVIYIASLDDIPDSLRDAMKMLGVEEVLQDDTSVVTRPAEFKIGMPTTVILSPKFLNEIKFGEESGGSLQYLFGLALVELVHQLLQGQVDAATIRTKVVSLVRRTM
jgi:tetratricopeptide (TPR) repeat protein